eukprot:14362338-Ditylum_brightwellii.AAC.1
MDNEEEENLVCLCGSLEAIFHSKKEGEKEDVTYGIQLVSDIKLEKQQIASTYQHCWMEQQRQGHHVQTTLFHLSSFLSGTLLFCIISKP